MTNIFNDYKQELMGILETMVSNGELPHDTDFSRVTVEPPRDAAHGDMATNAAMVLSKAAKKNPRQLAEVLVESIKAIDSVKTASIAGPGFINFHLNDNKWSNIVKDILSLGTNYGDCDLGKNKKVNIEYVSVNPTGPMHVGHVRGAVTGDALASLLKKASYDVTREYYFNDAGTQVDILSRTTYLRYKEALGDDIGEIPEGFYPGEYLKDVAKALIERDGNKWIDCKEDEWLVPIRNFAVNYMMGVIKEDLNLIGIKHDVFTNERDIVENGTLDEVFKKLEDMDLIYTGTLPPPRGKEIKNWEPVPLTLFRSSNFGDSIDRPLKKRDGTWAYIMPDLAYHYDKMRRGFDWMINILGKDHGGYLERIGTGVAALSDRKAKLDVIYIAMVKALKNGVPVKLSKRSGNLITLREMVEEVGAGAVRFLMLSRTPDSDLDFDFTKVVEQSKDNPVFYVQYAHARCCSILRNAKKMFPDDDLSDKSLMNMNMDLINSKAELKIIRFMAGWPRFVESAAEAHEPHRIAFYLNEMAAEFHAFWNKGKEDATLRFLIEDNKELSLARLGLVRSVALVIASGLKVMGVEPLEEMR